MCNLRRWCRARDSSEKGSEGQQPDRGNMAIWARRARSSSKLVNPVVFRLGPVTCAARKALSGFLCRWTEENLQRELLVLMRDAW